MSSAHASLAGPTVTCWRAKWLASAGVWVPNFWTSTLSGTTFCEMVSTPAGETTRPAVGVDLLDRHEQILVRRQRRRPSCPCRPGRPAAAAARRRRRSRVSRRSPQVSSNRTVTVRNQQIFRVALPCACQGVGPSRVKASEIEAMVDDLARSASMAPMSAMK